MNAEEVPAGHAWMLTQIPMQSKACVTVPLQDGPFPRDHPMPPYGLEPIRLLAM